MNKNVIIILLLLGFVSLTNMAFSASIYDGAWSLSNGDYATLNTTSNGTLAVILDDTEDETWEAYNGRLKGNYLRLRTLYGYVDAVYDVTFNSSSRGVATQISCRSNSRYYCRYPNGSKFSLQKIW